MIVNVGDIDCDGVNDLASVFGFEERVALVRKLNLPIPESVTLRTLDTTQDWFGHYAAGGGDNNNDGRPELWVFDDDFYNDTIWG